MTERKMLIIKYSWSQVIQQADDAGALFYEKLFELDPALRKLFPVVLDDQIVKLMDMITFLVTRLQAMGEITQAIKDLALKHVNYGVRPADYQTVRSALIWAIGESVPALWNLETKIAWEELYDELAFSMISASEGKQPGNQSTFSNA